MFDVYTFVQCFWIFKQILIRPLKFSFQDIFEHIRSHLGTEFLVKVSFLELYNEQLFDLLSEKPRREDAIVDIREDTKERAFSWVTVFK